MTPERLPLEVARDYLERAVAREPLYKPGVFVLAHATLLQGDVAQAGLLFDSLRQPFNQQAQRMFQSAKEQWKTTSVRWPGLVKRIEPLKQLLRPWIEHWIHVTIRLRGSTLYRLAQEWTEFPARLEQFNRAKNVMSAEDMTFDRFAFDLYIDGFREIPDIHGLVRTAAGLETADYSAEEARSFLDVLLSVEEIDKLDKELSGLETSLAMAKVSAIVQKYRKRSGEQAELPELDTEPPEIEQLKRTAVVASFSYLSGRLDELRAAWKEKNWDRCGRLLQALRDDTRAPDDPAASRMLEDVSRFEAGMFRPPGAPPVRFPLLERRLVRLFVPVYVLLDAWRESFGRDFVLESEYYLALTNFRRFTPAGFQDAMRQTKRLNTLVLIGKAPARVDPARWEELRILAQCLEIDAILRILAEPASGTEDDARSAASHRFLDLDATVVPKLRGPPDDTAAAPHVRAAVLRSQGLLARHEARKSERQTSRSVHMSRQLTSETEPSADEGTIELEPRDEVAEFEYFSCSYVLERAPETCLYMAEHLIASHRPNEARSQLDEALRLCPRHPGALALGTKLAARTA